jgi:spermidine synthase
VGWVVAVRAPAFRFAPGLSLQYIGSFPVQTALFVDGALAGATSDWKDDPLTAELLDWLPTALPYALPGRERVLVIGAGGGTEVWSAAAHGAREVTALELSPDIVELARRAPPPPGARSARVDWVTGDARSYLERSALRFDLVTVGPSGGPGTSAAGVHALSENFLHTVEAYATYLAHLGPDGVLAVTGWLTVPPREAVRTILTTAAAVRRMAPTAVEGGLVVARGWGTATVLVKPSGFTGTELQALKGWARERRLDLDWYPGLDRPVSEFNFLTEPDLFTAARAAVAGPAAAAQFGDAYGFAVAPVRDERPYPHHFLRPASLGTFIREARSSWLPFAEWGYVALAATLAQSAVLAALLLLVPAAAGVRRPPGLSRLLTYFGALGLGYLAAELAVIQTLGLLLGHPVYAVAATLVAFLVCSGAGSTWSDRVPSASGRIALALAAGVLVLLAVGLVTLVHLAQPAPWAVRLGLALVACLLPATLMGMAFPLGLRLLVAGERSRLAWAWAANGFASVVAAPLAALVALELGSRAVLVLAAGAYGVAWLAFPAARADRSTA